MASKRNRSSRAAAQPSKPKVVKPEPYVFTIGPDKVQGRDDVIQRMGHVEYHRVIVDVEGFEYAKLSVRREGKGQPLTVKIGCHNMTTTDWRKNGADIIRQTYGEPIPAEPGSFPLENVAFYDLGTRIAVYDKTKNDGQRAYKYVTLSKHPEVLKAVTKAAAMELSDVYHSSANDSEAMHPARLWVTLLALCDAVDALGQQGK